jgi:hypothetical protein
MSIQRLQALISLITPKPNAQQACLSDEQLIDFINNNLKGRALYQVQQHLQNCPKCYYEWQDICDVMKIAPNMPIDSQAHWTDKLRGLFTVKPILVTASVLASVLAIILFLPLFYQNSLQQQINQSYQQLQVNNVHPVERREVASAGFSFAPVQPTAQQLAFQHGMDVARGQLKQIDTLQETVYYEFGRWIVLLEQAAQSDIALSNQFWQKQQLILQIFKRDLIDDKAIIQHLDKLSAILQQLPNPEKLSLYDKLYRYVGFIQQDLI